MGGRVGGDPMRRCKIAPPGCIRFGKPCCEDCPDLTCTSRCLNAPKRCGCREDAPDLSPGQCGRRPEVDLDEIVRLYHEGLLQYQIALRLKCSTSTVSAVLKKMGVTCRGPRGIDE